MSEEMNEWPISTYYTVPEQVVEPLMGLSAEAPDSPPSKEPAAPIKLCCIESNVPEASLAVIREYPNIESSRAVIMSIFGQMPPESANTYPLLKEWVETTFHRALPKPSLLKPAVAPRPPTGISLRMMIDRDEAYTARMRRSTVSTGNITLDDDTVAEIIGEEDDMDDLMERLCRVACEQATDNGLENEDTETTGDERTGDEDNHEIQDESTDLARGEADRLRNYIRERFSEQLEERGIQ